MVRDYVHKGHRYWITVDPTIHQTTNEVYYIAYVSDQEPGGLFYGEPVRQGDGNILLFETELAAFINANAVKKSELDRN